MAEARETVPVLIHGIDKMSNQHGYLKVDLSTPLTPAAVRREAQRRWGWSPQWLWIFREIATREKVKFVQVCNSDDEWKVGMKMMFSDVSGNIRRQDQVIFDDADGEFLLDDIPIPLIGNRRNVIGADLLSRPLVPVPLYVRNQMRGGQDFLLTLPDKMAAKYVYRVIANELKVHWDVIKLMRWSGRLRDGKYCVHVCSCDGCFLDGAAEGTTFGREAGGIYGKGGLIQVERKILVENDMVWPVPQWRVIIYVASAT